MGIGRLKFGRKNNMMYYPSEYGPEASETVLESWKNSSFGYPKENKESNKKGFRIAQLGAIFAIKAHWTISEKVATIVMPTGTGKTEVMIAAVISEQCGKTCIVVPSNLLREQTAKRFCSLEKLREIGAIDNSVINPIVGVLSSIPGNKDELDEIIEKSNVIVTTMSLLCRADFKENYLKVLVSACDALIIDEAHHVAACSWANIKSFFVDTRCLQFTATPFRNDGKKIDGEIIYNFPLSLAQKEGFFKPINFSPVIEFDNDRKDLSIAEKAVALLEKDIERGFAHVILVRASNLERAKYLYEKIYKRYYSRFSPVLITSDKSKRDNEIALKEVEKGVSKIIVCVNMFSEGIDIPKLKICAIHDKYKSLPITLQFIGRFARSQTNLGEASIVANIVDGDIEEALEDLYSQDSDWNEVIRKDTDELIAKKILLQSLAKGFRGTERIQIDQIKPKISMFMFKTDDKNWNLEKLDDLFDKERCCHFINKDAKMIVIIEFRSSYVEWINSSDIEDKNWNLHILYWNEKRNIFFINTTDKSLVDKFAKAIFDKYQLVNGEEVFRCLFGIKRLMLSSVGLKTAVSRHHIHYRMFAGVDVADGINSAVVGTSTKSNLFGVGYEDGERVSIGCSYKGTIWSRWVEDIDYWRNWCNKQADKILNSDISTKEVLNNALVPEKIKCRPHCVPYRIDFPEEIETNTKHKILIKDTCKSYDVSLFGIYISFDETSPLEFCIDNAQVKESFLLNIDSNGYNITHKNGAKLNICFSRNRETTLVDYFQENPPIIWFVDGSSLDGNFLVKLKEKLPAAFPDEDIIKWDWEGVNIKKESQGKLKQKDSIQYHVIDKINVNNKYDIIFDDDGPGEVADIVAIRVDDNSSLKRIAIELYHCKYSHDVKAGARVLDLYEVCGQAEKCIKWVTDAVAMVDHLLTRQQAKKRDNGHSRFALGDENSLFCLKNKLRYYKAEFSVYIVQPGVDSFRITLEMHQILCCSQNYLKDTYSIPLKLICS